MSKYREALEYFMCGYIPEKTTFEDVKRVDGEKCAIHYFNLNELVNKETPKKPKTIIRTEKSFVNYECPNCDVSWGFTDTKVVKYCPCCGQHLDWSYVDDNEH